MNETKKKDFRRLMSTKGYKQVKEVGKYKVKDFGGDSGELDNLFIKKELSIPIN